MGNEKSLIGKIIRVSLAELIGTFILVFAGCGAIAMNRLNPTIGHIGVSVTFGIVVMSMIYAVGHISGAHLNPAVTISFAVNRHFPVKLVLPYIMAQCLGAILACYFLYDTLLPVFQTNQIVLNIGVTQPVIDSVWLAFAWEFALTFILMFVITSVATDSRAVGALAGVAIGAAVCLDGIVGGPITGASMNPARSLAPALVSGQWQYLYIYIIAPVFGAVAGGYVYHLVCSGCDQCKKKYPIL